MLLGFDIGGTKCAVITGGFENGQIEIYEKRKIATDLSVNPEEMIARLVSLADEMVRDKKVDSIGISCGGPLDSSRGIILGPPNLIGWECVPITDIIGKHFGVPTYLQNDANACALAEWKFGAGVGCKNMVFMTFGTGLGAGLILDGKLYTGTNDNAGECGHIRLDRFGPVGYGKAGSFEGFCSGNGLAQLGFTKAIEASQQGKCPMYYKIGMKPDDVSAKTIADAADAGDEVALDVYGTCAEYLGRGLSVLIDILNPERIVIGSVYARSENLLRDGAVRVIEKEALPVAAACCEVVPAKLGEQIGDYAALATALI